MKVITIRDFGSIPKGSVFDACWAINHEGVNCWKGTWLSRGDSFEVMVPCDVCDEYKTDDPFEAAKKVLSYNQEREIERIELEQLAYLKAKYETRYKG